MSQANINFVIAATASGAVNAFRAVTREQDKATTAFGKMSKGGKSAGTDIDKLGRSFLRFGSIIGVGGVLASGIRQFEQNIDNISTKVIGFENSMRGLVSLGRNVDIIPSLREDVLALSNANAIVASEIANAKFNIQSGASSLSKQIQDDILKQSILVTKFYGGDLADNTQAVTKAVNIYIDKVGSVADITAKLGFTADEAAVTINDLATLFPDVGATAAQFGYSLDEVNAALIVATQVGGRNEKTFTGIRNIITRMSNATKEGIVLQGSFLDKLRQLSQVDPDTLKKIFGDETIATIASLVSNTDKLAVSLEKSKRIAAGFIDEKMAKRMADPIIALVDRLEKLKAIQENIVSGGLGAEGFGDIMERKQKIDTGTEAVKNSSVANSLRPAWWIRWTDQILNAISTGGDDSITMRNSITGRVSQKQSKPRTQSIAEDLLDAANVEKRLGLDPERSRRQMAALRKQQADQALADSAGPNMFMGPQLPNAIGDQRAIQNSITGSLRAPISKLGDWLTETNEKYKEYQGPLGALRLAFEATTNTANAMNEAKKKELEDAEKSRQKSLEQSEFNSQGIPFAVANRGRHSNLMQDGESVESYAKRTGVRGYDPNDPNSIYANRADQDAFFSVLGRQRFGAPDLRRGRGFDRMYGPHDSVSNVYNYTGEGNPGVNALQTERDTVAGQRAALGLNVDISRAQTTIYINSANFTTPMEVARLARMRQANQIASL